jgi:hypothetical protein
MSRHVFGPDTDQTDCYSTNYSNIAGIIKLIYRIIKLYSNLIDISYTYPRSSKEPHEIMGYVCK